MTPTPLIGMDIDGLRQTAAACGMPRFKAAQMARRIYRLGADSIESLTELSLRERQTLRDKGYAIGRTPPLGRQESRDGTVKYLFEGAPGRAVEAVYIPDRDRATLCVSSQAGCRMGCRFCMTGRGGLSGQLTAAQIVNQILSVDDAGSLTNIVFMGMGEPTDNPDAVIRAVRIITDQDWGMGLSPRRVTVSSIGNPEGLRSLIEETQAHIAVSAHSPYAGERLSLMPSQKAWPLDKTVEMLKEYDWAHQRRLSLEYIMWRGVNDDARHARSLASLVKGTATRVNLIPFHPVPGCGDLQPSDRQTMENFRDMLNDEGIVATIRASRGQDIMAACGMLAGRDNTNHPQ